MNALALVRNTAAWLPMLLLLGCLAAAPLPASASPALITPATLMAQLQSPEPPLLLDASPGPAHAKAHIAGAVPVDYFSYGLASARPQQRERWLQSLGVRNGRRIVIYDQGGTYFAPRLFHELLFLGLPPAQLQVLDGGLSKWLAEGGPVTAERTPAPTPGDVRLGATRAELRVGGAAFVQASGDLQNNALVDALGPDYHFGAAKFFDRAGHIPGAKLWPAEDFFNADKTFKSPAEIRRMAAWLGVREDQTIHTHCGGGGAAAVPFFALHAIAGFPKVTLYRESQMEWLRDERGLPFWTHPAPRLLRDAGWLAGWGSPMLRMVGVSGISVLDVRPEAAYRAGHVPFALPADAEMLRQGLAQPQALAAALGAAGVNPAHELVIASDGGLNERSALAFVILQQLGARRVSLLRPSMDDWVMEGQTLVKEPTTVGPPRSMQEPAVPPAAFAAVEGMQVIVRDARSASGEHPRVFVAAGAQAPKRTPGERWLHLPHTQLVNADGSVKPAAQMWRALEKAGVPRYAEIVLFADDPAHAAINHVALQMLGFTHTRVWWP